MIVADHGDAAGGVMRFVVVGTGRIEVVESSSSAWGIETETEIETARAAIGDCETITMTNVAVVGDSAAAAAAAARTTRCRGCCCRFCCWCLFLRRRPY